MNQDEQILPYIESPADVRMLDARHLRQLAEEVRRHIIDTVSETGGHLAPNLGTVELTLALHSIFESPWDRIVWDVGHQSYTHKLITGRREEFSTLRQSGGLSGFPKRNESPHDPYETGHSSTSVAAALGMAIASDRRGEDREVVAVIGDGALTGGLAYEGLNNAGDMGVDLTVVLNDNSMSIAPNVGAMSRYLTRLRTEPAYHRLRDDVENLVNSIPRVGRPVVDSMKRVKGGLKYLLIPGIIFEQWGFTYLGPVDGHDIEATMEVLQKARDMEGPVLVHAVTVKGRGFEPAEKEPDKFHGLGTFNAETGARPSSSSVKYTGVFGDELVRLAEDDDRILAITAAMPDGTGLDGFASRFPGRFFDVGIAEQAAVTLAAGMAVEGMRPVVAVYSTFLQRAYDQVVHDVAHQDLNVVFAIDRAGLVGADGDTHQGSLDVAYLRHVPNMTVMAPADENELRHMLTTAVRCEGPAAVRYPRGTGWGTSMQGPVRTIPVGKGELLRSGDDAGIVAFGHPVRAAERAGEKLAAEGIESAVVNARFAKPLDESLILSVAERVPVLVTVEEGTICGGFGSAVLELLSENLSRGSMPQVCRLGLPDDFIEHGDQEDQRAHYRLDTAGIYGAVKDCVKTGL